MIRKEIMKGYLARDVCLSLQQQEEIMSLIVDRENIKLQDLLVQKTLFRHKITNFGFDFEYLDKANEEEEYRMLA
jgi:hypothetical protein